MAPSLHPWLSHDPVTPERRKELLESAEQWDRIAASTRRLATASRERGDTEAAETDERAAERYADYARADRAEAATGVKVCDKCFSPLHVGECQVSGLRQLTFGFSNL